MSNILTPKQERFALNLFSGMSQRESWVAAGYSSNFSMAVLDVNASRLANNTKVILRIKELREELALNTAIMPVEERQVRLSSIGRGILTDYIDNEGNIDLETNPGALAEVVIEDWKGGKDQRAMSQTKKVKLHSPISAIDLLNKMDKLYSEGSTVNIDNRTLNIYVKDSETRELLESVGNRTKKLQTGGSGATE